MAEKGRDVAHPEAVLRVGLLGAGGISEMHARILRRVPGVTLVGVCDRDPAKAALLQQKQSIPEAFTNLKEMVRGVKPDVIHVLVPPFAHAETAAECLENGCHVFIEKPMCLSAAECDQVADAAACARRTVGVNHNLTYLRSFRRVVREIQGCRLGRVEHVTVCYNFPLPELAAGPHHHWLFRGTGHLVYELGAHPLSLITRLVGKVAASSAAVSGPTRIASGLTFYHTWQSSFVCERGTAQFFLSVGGGYEDLWVRVEGQDGAAHVDLGRNTFRLSEKTRFSGPSEHLRDAAGSFLSTFGSGVRNAREYLAAVWDAQAALATGPMFASINDFYEALRAGRTPPVGLAEGASVVTACEALVQSGTRFLAGHEAHESVATG